MPYTILLGPTIYNLNFLECIVLSLDGVKRKLSRAHLILYLKETLLLLFYDHMDIVNLWFLYS